MRTKIVNVTPQLAEEWLKHNTNNRKAKENIVKFYAEEMLEGRWEKGNPSPIVFGENGELKDGQHRLMAVIKANIPIEFLVCICSDNVHTFDVQAKRTIADYAKTARGYDLNYTLAGSISLYMNKGSHSIKRSMIEVSDEYEKNRDLWDLSYSICSKGKPKIMKISSSVVAVFQALRCGVNEEDLKRFSYVVTSGMSEGKHESSAILLRNMILIDKAGRNRSEVWRQEGIIEEYINNFVNRKARSKKIVNPTWCYTKSVDVVMEE